MNFYVLFFATSVLQALVLFTSNSLASPRSRGGPLPPPLRPQPPPLPPHPPPLPHPTPQLPLSRLGSQMGVAESLIPITPPFTQTGFKKNSYSDYSSLH